ncbi:MAG: FkbM family methyltransferase [Gemmatimonadales bacterium]|nr:MAG: FkbM family methyltransferase [Gemmatimonadales bacterium]
MNSITRHFPKACFRALGYYPASIGGFDFRVDPYHIRFWSGAARGKWEPRTFEILKEFLAEDSIYCDVGAWVGPTVIYAARLCREVICFEPDPAAYRYLSWNIELNELDNVKPFNCALADRRGIRRMSSFGGSRGDSMTSLLDPDSAGTSVGTSVDVLTLTWNDVQEIPHIDRIDMMKIDIEGGEFELLPALRDFLAERKPVVYLSTHAPYLEEDEREEKMALIAEVMGVYGKCLDDELNPVPVDQLTGRDARENFRAFVFMD